MRSEGLELHHLRPFLLHVVDGDLERSKGGGGGGARGEGGGARGGGEGRFEFLIIL